MKTAATHADPKFIKVYAHPLRQKLLRALEQHGPSTQTELASLIDAAPASARHHLHQLADVGLVRRAGTRPGPKGITEILFAATTQKKGKTMHFATRHGTPDDLVMRKLRLNEVLETHRVGSRIIMRQPQRFFGLYSMDVSLPPAKLRELQSVLSRAARDFLAKWGNDSNGEACTLHLGIYPRHEQPVRG